MFSKGSGAHAARSAITFERVVPLEAGLSVARLLLLSRSSVVGGTHRFARCVLVLGYQQHSRGDGAGSPAS